MNCKPIAIAIITVICVMNQTAAQIGLSKEVVDSIWSYNYELGTELRSISYYNQIIKSEKLSDTIIVQIVDGEVLYEYNKYKIKDLGISHDNDSPVQLQYAGSRPLNYLYAIVQKNGTDQLRLLATRTDSCETKIRIENYRDEILFGNYIEMCSSGDIYRLGNYDQIDSVYLDTITYFDPDTYEEIIEIKERKVFPIKCGNWQVKTDKGIRIEEYEPCK